MRFEIHSNGIKRGRKPRGTVWIIAHDFFALPWRGHATGSLWLCYGHGGRLIMYRPYGSRGYQYHKRSGHLAQFDSLTKLEALMENP